MPSLIGSGPNQVPTNAMLGSLAFQNKESPRVVNLQVDTAADVKGNLLVGGSTNPLNTAVAVAGEVSETVNGVTVKTVSQVDVGPGPDQVPLNGQLGEFAYLNKDAFVITPAKSATPQQIGSMVFQLTSDTSLQIFVKGSDGVVRSATLTLA